MADSRLNSDLVLRNAFDEASSAINVNADLSGVTVTVGGQIETTVVTVYKTIVDEASASVTYVGRALPGVATSAASWQISRFTLTGNVLAEETADGDLSFNNVWDNRASLSYS